MIQVQFSTQRKDGSYKVWKNVVVPVKFGRMLDEQLDYAVVSLSRIKRRIFEPLTRCKLTITTQNEYGSDETEILEYFVANDNYTESPVGSGVYDHELSLIELTKFLECFPVETLCFTNTGGNLYGAVDPRIEFSTVGGATIKFSELEGFPKNYVTPSLIGTTYNLFNVIFDAAISFEYGYVTITVTYENGDVVTFEKDKLLNTFSSTTIYFDTDTFEIRKGRNEVRYEVRERDASGVVPSNYNYYSFTIIGLDSHYPIKPWTNETVIERLLQLVEPIRVTQTPRFAFEIPTGKAAAFEESAPEYTFTRLNLRECLQTIGGRIHAEPRLKTVNGQDTITFDFYGEQEYATIKNFKNNTVKRLSSYKYATNKGVFDIEQTCTRLDGYMDNLVNRIEWERATIGQPFENSVVGETLRPSTYYTRTEESDNYYFQTSLGIDRIVSLKYKRSNGEWADLTPYVYEKTIYDNVLSAYANAAPAKSFALYYTQGQKGIKGFFYKAPDAFSGTVNDYTIVNIVREVTGDTVSDYTQIELRLSYVPLYSTRVSHGKQYVSDYLPLPRTINYAQSANQVETRFYGENIKATAQRLGNIELSYTFNVRHLENIPKAGTLWDDEYYISTVAVEVGIDLLAVTVGLSKNFNRKSQYIGANSYRRLYEVSETMVEQRHTSYNEYLIIRKGSMTENEFLPKDENGNTIAAEMPLINSFGFQYGVDYLFYRLANEINVDRATAEISTMVLQTYSKKNAANNRVLLPIVASAFGNVMEFTWACEDNFSAGMRAEEQTSTSNYKWIFGVGTEYADYYGRAYYANLAFLSQAQVDYQYSYNQITTPNDYPLANASNNLGVSDIMAGTSRTSQRYILRKDSREALRGSYSIEFVADGNNYVLGSALTSGNPLVSWSGVMPHLYVLPKRINKFSEKLTASDLSAQNALDYGEIDVNNVTSNSFFFRHNGKTMIGGDVVGKSWVIALPITQGETTTVETDEGDIEEYTQMIGGDILLGENVDIMPDDTFADFEIFAVKDIFKDYINKK